MLWIWSYRAVRLATLSESKSGWVATGVEFVDPRTPGVPPSPWPPSTVARKFSIASEEDGVRRFLKAAEDVGLWTTQSWRHNLEVDDGGLWIVEARRRGTYRLVARINAPDARLDELPRMLLRLAGMEVPDEMRPRN